jgi:hypothetical protein
MPNMGYCRFYNTLSDLRDCARHLNEKVSSEEERARRELIKLCRSIAERTKQDRPSDE